MKQGQDTTFKYISREHFKEFLDMLPKEIGITIDENTTIEILTEEQIAIEPSLYRPDMIIRIGNLILMIEFQSTFVGTRDEKRFRVYISNYDLKRNIQNHKIVFLVISTVEYSKIAKYRINDWDVFTFPIISFFEIDEREIISNIREKLRNNKHIDEDEIISLSMTPVMVRGRDNIINQFRETAKLMSQITYETEKIKESAYGIALMLGNMYFEKDDPMRKEILGDFMMKVDCITEYGEERYNAGKDEGEELGKELGKIELIRNLLSDGEITLESAISQLMSLECEMSVIEEVSGLTQEEIENIQKSK